MLKEEFHPKRKLLNIFLLFFFFKQHSQVNANISISDRPLKNQPLRVMRKKKFFGLKFERLWIVLKLFSALAIKSILFCMRW